MDRPGRVIEALDARLPDSGWIVDVGAGDGFTAERLSTRDRRLLAVEPATEMIRPDRQLSWVQAEAALLPFETASLDAAYATWAYFFSRGFDPSPGLRELHRVVKPGGPLLIVENLGSDEFTAMAPSDITADRAFWDRRGFDCTAIDTVFEFDDLDEARTLLSFYFGEETRSDVTNPIEFRVGLFSDKSRGPGSETTS